jgi:hypothetical protein
MDYCERWEFKQAMSADFPPFQQVQDPCSSKNGSFYNALEVEV